MKLTNLTIAKRLALGFGTLGIFILVLSGLSYYAAVQNDHAIEEIGIVRLPSVQSLLVMSEAQTAIESAENTLLSPGLTPAAQQAQFQRFSDAKKRADDAWKVYEPLPQSVEEEQVWKQFVPAWEKWWKDHEEYARLAKAYIGLNLERPDALISDLQHSRADHYKLIMGAFDHADRGEKLEGGTDPTACFFGKWLASYQTKNPAVGEFMKKVKPDHDAVHALVARIKDAVAKGERTEALHLVHEDLEHAVDTVFSHLTALQGEAGKAHDAYEKLANQVVAVNPQSFGVAERFLNKLVEINAKIAADQSKTSESQANVFKAGALTAIPVGLAIAVLFGLLTSRSVIKPVKATTAMLQDIAEGEGDLTRRLDASRADEIGEMAKWFNVFVEKIQAMIRDISGNAGILASSATELSAVSGQMGSSVKDMSDKTHTVAAAAEEASTNTVSVAASMEQATTSLASVASATEEMSATVGEIASNSEKARAISTEATQQADAVSLMMKDLGQAAQQIGQVTETITSISAQTNLLALNATIEAARAGAAGKGFAVVANEIKELAQQTAGATEDIKAKIAGIQASTGGAIGDIEAISHVIRQVGEIVSTIAAAIEEQSVVTRDVANNIAQASTGMQDSNERISQTAGVSQSIAEDIAQVNAAISEISHGGEQVQISAGELSKLSEQLRAMVGRFKV